ncbi:MAG: hypothetical protein WBQ73_00080 [Candidatus Babeliales bacterium]
MVDANIAFIINKKLALLLHIFYPKMSIYYPDLLLLNMQQAFILHEKERISPFSSHENIRSLINNTTRDHDTLYYINDIKLIILQFLLYKISNNDDWSSILPYHHSSAFKS